MQSNVTALNHWLSQLDENQIENIANQIESELWLNETTSPSQEKRDELAEQIKQDLTRIGGL